MFQLKDPALFREQCYIGGAWCDADGKETIAVTNPADNSKLGTIPRMGAADTRLDVQLVFGLERRVTLAVENHASSIVAFDVAEVDAVGFVLERDHRHRQRKCRGSACRIEIQHLEPVRAVVGRR